MFGITELNGGDLVLREAAQKQLLPSPMERWVSSTVEVKVLVFACADTALHTPQSYRSHKFCLCSSCVGGGGIWCED